MDEKLQSFFQNEKEEIESKKAERKIPIEQRRKMKEELNSRGMISSIPSNRKELTTYITQRIINTYVQNRDTKLWATPRRLCEYTFTCNHVYKAADIKDIIRKPEGRGALEALSYCSKTQMGRLYYNGMDNKFFTVNKSFFEKHGIKMEHVKCNKDICDTLKISYTDKEEEEFVNYILNNYNNAQVSLSKPYIESIKRKIALLDRDEAIVNEFKEKIIKPTDLAVLDICKKLIEEYKKLPLDDESETIYIYPKFGNANVESSVLSREAVKVLDDYKYLDETRTYYPTKGNQLLVYLPYLEEKLEELGIYDIDISCSRNESEIGVNIESFIEVVLGVNKSNKKKNKV